MRGIQKEVPAHSEQSTQRKQNTLGTKIHKDKNEFSKLTKLVLDKQNKDGIIDFISGRQEMRVM